MQASERKALRGVRGPVGQPDEGRQKIRRRDRDRARRGLAEHHRRARGGREERHPTLKTARRRTRDVPPLSSIRGEALRDARVQNEYGYVGLASELVEYDREYDGIFKNLLGRTVVVEDLDCGITISRRFSNAFRIVTLDGQVLNRGGSMTGRLDLSQRRHSEPRRRAARADGAARQPCRKARPCCQGRRGRQARACQSALRAGGRTGPAARGGGRRAQIAGR